MWKRITKALVAGLMGLNAWLSAPMAHAEIPPIDPSIEQTLTISTGSELSIMDSLLYDDVPTSDMLGQTFEGLYRVVDGNDVELGQAASVDISEDGMTYTFKLRDDIFWSNGDPVTAEDFEYTYQRIVDPSSGSSAQSSEVFKNATAIREGDLEVSELGVKALDDKTLEIQLEYAAPYFPKLLTGSRFLPVNKKFVEEKGDQYGTSAENIVSNGPFKMEGWNGTNLEWKLTKNDHYWDKEHVYLEDVNVHVVKEASTGADLFDAGQLDYAVLTDEFVAQYDGSENFHSVSKAMIGYMSFNTQREATGNAKIRRAIAQAIDKELYADSVIQDGSIPLNGLVPLNFDLSEDGLDYREEAGDMLVYDLDQAKKDWEEGKKELGIDSLELELLINDQGLSKRTAEFVQAQLEENLEGLKLTIRSVPLKNRLEFQRASDFDIFYGTWAPDYQEAMNFLEQYTTDGGTNFAKYSNEEYDRHIDEARHEFANDPAKRRESLIAAEKIGIQEDAVMAPLYQGATSYLLADNVEGFEILPIGRTINLRTTYIAE